MSGNSADGVVVHVDEASGEPLVDTVRRAALDLLAALPERPARLRLSAAGVVVDLDWRTALVPAPPAPMAVTAVTAVHAEQAVLPVIEVTAPAAEEHFVCAPTIGTFYQAPEPGAAPFVSEGDMIAPGQQVGIVEAMKLMMPVEAERRGRVTAVLAKDGQAVEYGERLLALGPVDAD